MPFASWPSRLGALTALALAALLFPAQAQAPGDIRVALVIGNSAYANANLLANPANDAKAMGDTLRGLGFTVIELRDGHKAQMAEAITKVGAALKGKRGVGMLYFAGHGLQLDTATMATIEIDQDPINFQRLVPVTGMKDGCAAHQNRK